MTGPHQKNSTATSFEEVDQIDLKIMEVLQKDARITNQALADRVALSPSACLRRVRDLETRGLITAYRAQIQVDRIRSIIVVMAHITFSQHTIKNLHEFDACIESLPEIVESYRVSGNVDYILRVVVSDMHAWKRIMTVLVNGGFGVEKIVSHFLMDQIKTFKGYRLLQKPGDGV